MKKAEWDIIIKPKKNIFYLGWEEIKNRRDLLFLFVKRDLVVLYKQTILGPLWFILQPLLSTITFTFIFGNIANLSTDGIPAPLFYLSGIILYGYFGESLRKTSASFINNIQIFGKVYFPRLIVPISIVISNFFLFLVQFLFLLIFYFYYLLTDPGFQPVFNSYLLILPVLIIIMGLLGLSFGIIIAALTTKYKDLIHLVGFGVQLIMYLSPVIYPLSTVGGKFKLIILLNPVTPLIESFRFCLFGKGEFNWWYLGYSVCFAMILFFVSILLFNRIDKTFADTL